MVSLQSGMIRTCGRNGNEKMSNKIKVAFICVHNSCRSQIAEALGKKLLSDICDCYSAGTEKKSRINQDAVRLMKQVYGIDMEDTQYPKLFDEIPEADIVISMGCNVICPYLPGKLQLNWGLEDPSGRSDEEFLKIMQKVEDNLKKLRIIVQEGINSREA